MAVLNTGTPNVMYDRVLGRERERNVTTVAELDKIVLTSALCLVFTEGDYDLVTFN